MDRLAVILTHFDSASYLPDAVCSILGQTYENIHLYLLDDCSPGMSWYENLGSLVNSDKLSIYQSSKNVGTYRLKNRFIKSLDADYIAFHDADDVSLPNRLELQIKALKKSNIGLLGTAYYTREGSSCDTNYVYVPRNVNDSFVNGKDLVSLHPTWMMKRDLFDCLGGFDFETRFGADDEFLSRAIFCTKVRNLKNALYIKREHYRSLTGAASTGLKSKTRLDYICKTDRKITLLKSMSKKERESYLKIKDDTEEFSILKIS